MKAFFSNLVILAIALGVSNAHAYKGQPKNLECKIFDGHVIQLNLDDVPGDKIHMDAEYWPKICTDWTPAPIALSGGHFDSFAWAYLGCQMTKGKYQVAPTYMNAAFTQKTARGTFTVNILWQGDKFADVDIEEKTKHGDLISSIQPESCTVTAVY